MNKRRVNDRIPVAKKALIDFGIAENGKILKTYRSQIASFGAAVTMGSLPAAVAFFCDQGSSDVNRPQLICAMYFCITGETKTASEILDIVCADHSAAMTEDFIDASLSLKLAMNFFDLDKGGDKA